MSIKVISFLGTVVRETTYSYRDRSYQGGLFQIALRQFVSFDEMLVFVTPEALEKAYPALAALGDPRIKPVSIRRGRTSEGLWEIFKSLVDQVEEDDSVIFDITHGLRSIPFLTFLAAAYLRSAKNVTIQAVLYGALELGSPAPVIDLTEFVSLLDWLTATDQFIKTGHAGALAKELDRSADLKELARTVENIATGLHLLRPNEVSAAAVELPARLQAVRAHLPPPFTLLADNLVDSYGRFGQAAALDAQAQLNCQLGMVNWYHSRGQIAHALSLGREWVVSLLCAHCGLDMESKEERAEMEILAGGGSDKNKRTGEVYVSPYLAELKKVAAYKDLKRLWSGENGLPNLRNDVLHSGFRKNPKPSEELKKAVDAALADLNTLAASWVLPGRSAPVKSDHFIPAEGGTYDPD